MEETPEAYVENLIQAMREVKRVLKDDGILWLNLGDGFSGSGKGVGGKGTTSPKQLSNRGSYDASLPCRFSLGPKQLLGMPWRVALALQDDGWILRSDIIWSKSNAMPESVKDRPTRSHEYVFLLAKRTRYYYDATAIAEPSVGVTGGGFSRSYAEAQPNHGAMKLERPPETDTRNARDVWVIPTGQFRGAHYATMSPELARRCILAGSRKGDVVLDPFSGAGTTALAAISLGRKAIGVDLSFEYSEMAMQRIARAPRPLL
jgi:DNA modification methylase